MPYHKLSRVVSAFPPATRTVVLDVWGFEGEIYHKVYPVLGITAKNTDHYYAPDGLDTASTDAGLRKLGWDHSEGYSEFDVIFIGPEGNPCDLGDLSADDSVAQVVACPWPPEEDEARFAPIIGEMREQLARIQGARSHVAS